MDNFYGNCPAKMDDGRFTTNYRTDSCINEQIKYVNGIVRDDDYRYFLQQNGQKLMDSEWAYLKKTFNCMNNACVHNYPLRMDPNNFRAEREKADLLFMSNDLPDPLKCKMYADYRLTEGNLQFQNMFNTKKE
jgi:hypothetical protein